MARVARTWLTRSWPQVTREGHKDRAPAFAPSNPSAFIRAYVRVSCSEPALVRVERNARGHAVLYVGTRAMARVNAKGELSAPRKKGAGDGLVSMASSMLLTSPQNVDLLAGLAKAYFKTRLAHHYLHFVNGSPPRKPLASRDAEAVLGYEGCAAFERMKLAAYRGMAMRAIQSLAAHVQPDGLRIQRSQRIGDRETAALLTRADHVGRCAREAFEAYPALMRGLKLVQIREIVQAIAQTKHVRLVDQLAVAYAIPPGAVRRFHRHTVQRVFGSIHRVDERLIEVVARLPAHLHPRTCKDYRAAGALADLQHSWEVAARSLEHVHLGPSMRGVAGPLAEEASLRHLGGMFDPLLHLGRFLQLEPDAWPYLKRRLPLSLAAMARMNTEWHALHRRLAAERALAAPSAVDEPEAWPGVLRGPVALPGGLTAFELVTRAELELEGEAMGHCVDGYDVYCLAGDSRIIAIRDAAGRGVSTLEIVRDDAGGFIERQHYGPGNRLAPASACRAVRHLLDRLNGGMGSRDPWPCLVPLSSGTDPAGGDGLILDPAELDFWRRWLRLPRAAAPEL